MSLFHQAIWLNQCWSNTLMHIYINKQGAVGYPRPVLAFGYYCCLHLFVCMCLCVCSRVGVNSGVGVGVGFNSNSGVGVGIGVETSGVGVGVGVDILEIGRSWSWSWSWNSWSWSWSWNWYSRDLPELELELKLPELELELELKLSGVELELKFCKVFIYIQIFKYYWCAILIAHQIVMAKHGGSCVHFSGISTCGRTSRETVSHPQCPPLPTLCNISLPIYVIVTNKLLQPLTTTWYDSLVLSFSFLKI